MQNSLFKFMLSKINRSDRRDIERIFEFGRFVNSQNLSLKFLPERTKSKKISFIVPKIVSKKAVVRNLLRRRGYAVLKKYFSHIPFGFIGVFIFGKKSIIFFGKRKTKTYNPILNLENEIKNILTKIN